MTDSFRKGHFKKIRSDLKQAAFLYLKTNVNNEVEGERLIRRFKLKDGSISFCAATYWKCLAQKNIKKKDKDFIKEIINNCVDDIINAKSDSDVHKANELMKAKIRVIFDFE